MQAEAAHQNQVICGFRLQAEEFETSMPSDVVAIYPGSSTR